MAIQTSDPLLWDIDRASRELSLSKGYLYRLVADKEVPFVRQGRRVLFSPIDLRAWLEARKVPAARR